MTRLQPLSRSAPVALLLAALLSAGLLAACAPAAPVRPSRDLPTPAPSTPVFGPEDAPEPGLPLAASAEVGRFVWQTDGVYGYRILRPAEWKMVDSGVARSYISLAVAGETPLAMHVVNLRAHEWPEPWGLGSFLRSYEAAGSFESWIAVIERRELGGAEKPSLPDDLRRVAAAFIAQSDGPNGPRIMPFAFKVSDGQPLILALEANASPSDLEGLKESGAWDDFIAMLRSLSAVPVDPARVTPWAPTATPTPAQPEVSRAPALAPAPAVE